MVTVMYKDGDSDARDVLTICVLLRLSMCWFNGMDSQRWEGRWWFFVNLFKNSKTYDFHL